VRDAFTFEAADSDHADAVRGPVKGPWPGVVRLRFDWSEFTAVPDDAPSFQETKR